ncbi:MAG: HAD family hydrolase [Candidatus Woesearchaeota archaeon]
MNSNIKENVCGLEAIISDLDGTLVSVSGDYCSLLFTKVFREIGLLNENEEIDKITAEDLFYNPRREEIIKEIYNKKSKLFDKDLFWDTYHKIEKQKDILENRIKNLKVYDDVKTLKFLSQAGVKIGIITQSQKEIAFAEIKKIEREIGLKIRKEFVIHNSSYDFMKPDYRVLERLIERMDIKKNLIYVGDSETDLLLIKNFYDNSGIKNIKILPLIIIREYYKNNKNLFLNDFLNYNFYFRKIKCFEDILKEKNTNYNISL